MNLNVVLNPVNAIVLSFVPSIDTLILTTVSSNAFFMAVMQCQRHWIFAKMANGHSIFSKNAKDSNRFVSGVIMV